jgi:hypothetical protein
MKSYGRGHNGERKDESSVLAGNSLKIYRYLYKQGTAHPASLHDIQRGLDLSSVSLAQYHVRKLIEAGLVKEVGSGFVVDRVVFDNMVRIRRSVVPFQVMFCVFFATCLVILLTLLRPSVITGTYIFSLIIVLAAIGLFGFEALKATSKYSL